MNCKICGFNIEADQIVCSNCQQHPQVTVLQPEEQDNFQGLTIEQAHNEEKYYEPGNSDSTRRIYVKHINFGSSNGSLLTKLLLVAVLTFIVILALPLAIILVTFFAVIWFFIRLISPKRF